jgi:hypothetical protein
MLEMDIIVDLFVDILMIVELIHATEFVMKINMLITCVYLIRKRIFFAAVVQKVFKISARNETLVKIH